MDETENAASILDFDIDGDDDDDDGGGDGGGDGDDADDDDDNDDDDDDDDDNGGGEDDSADGWHAVCVFADAFGGLCRTFCCQLHLPNYCIQLIATAIHLHRSRTSDTNTCKTSPAAAKQEGSQDVLTDKAHDGAA